MLPNVLEGKSSAVVSVMMFRDQLTVIKRMATILRVKTK